MYILYMYTFCMLQCMCGTYQHEFLSSSSHNIYYQARLFNTSTFIYGSAVPRLLFGSIYSDLRNQSIGLLFVTSIYIVLKGIINYILRHTSQMKHTLKAASISPCREDVLAETDDGCVGNDYKLLPDSLINLFFFH